MTARRPELTPSQTAGPYLRIGLIHDRVGRELVDPSDSRAILIRGQLLDGQDEPVPDGVVEIWQANAAGRYRHELDRREELPLEQGFTGFGRCSTENEGWFEFVTVKPGPVPWPEGGLQAPHIAIGIFARGLLKRVVTRMYFPDEEAANATDPVLTRLDERARSTLIARPEGRGLRFDIRLQGPRQTTFFAV